MTDNKIYTWTKDNSRGRSHHFQLSPKLQGKVTRKGLWSPDGYGEIGTRKLRFRSNGKANMSLKVVDDTSQKQVGTLNFYWKDFQKSKLELSNGSIYYFRSFNLLRGIWSWIREDTANEQYIFTVDSPFHRSGTIENQSKELPALERDILLLLGLHLQHYINIWLITIILVVAAVVSGS
jgi:hypothetical protein